MFSVETPQTSEFFQHEKYPPRTHFTQQCRLGADVHICLRDRPSNRATLMEALGRVRQLLSREDRPSVHYRYIHRDHCVGETTSTDLGT